MNDERGFDRAVDRWLDDGSDATPPEVIDAVLLAVRSTPQERDLGAVWRTRPMNMYFRAAAVIVTVGVVGVAAFYAFGSGPNLGIGPAPEPTPTESLIASSEESPIASQGEVTEQFTELLDGFLDARVAGNGAQQYLADTAEDIPLLYATSSGAAYERAQFERVDGTGWPYGWMAFTVRLFSGDTVVEQLFFIPPDGREGLHYQADGFGTEIAPTTEDGQPVASRYSFFDSEVTLRAAHPWIFYDGATFGRLIPAGPDVRPTTDGGERNDWDHLVLVADPAPIGTGCQASPDPADAEALAGSIGSDPDVDATAPVAVRVGDAEGLMVDVGIAAGASVCDGEGVWNLDGERGVLVVERIGLPAGERMRLYLFDAPEGSSMRILVIAIAAPESRFEATVEAAAPVIDSVEFQAP